MVPGGGSMYMQNEDILRLNLSPYLCPVSPSQMLQNIVNVREESKKLIGVHAVSERNVRKYFSSNHLPVEENRQKKVLKCQERKVPRDATSKLWHFIRT